MNERELCLFLFDYLDKHSNTDSSLYSYYTYRVIQASHSLDRLHEIACELGLARGPRDANYLYEESLLPL